MPSSEQALDRSVQRLGARIRDLRKARAMTIVELATAAELSHPFISQIERGLARPSMSSLFRIARTLGTDQQTLLAESLTPPDTAAVRRRSDEGAAVASGGMVHALVDGADRPFIPLEYVGEDAEFKEYWRHDEDEFLYVVSGRVRLDVDGAVELLEPLDSAYLSGGVAHRWASADGGAFRLLVVKQHLRHHPS